MLVRFGAFELDLESGELRRSGKLVRLQQQPFKVLSALVRRPGQVVTREELRALLWDEGTHVEFERGLNFAVNRVREALGDSARAPRFVETVQRRGYRFVAPVEVLSEVLPQAPPAPRPGSAERRRVSSVVAVALVASAVLLVVVASAAFLTGRPRARTDPRARSLYEEARSLCGPDGWRKSIRLYEEARARAGEPGDAALVGAASTGLARSYVNLAEHGYLRPEQAFPPARAAALEALRHGEDAEARVLLATVLLEYEWNADGARRAIDRAEAAAHASASLWTRIARLRSFLGDDAAALVAARRAEALDPASDEAVVELAECLYRSARFEEAARVWRVASGRRPTLAHHALFSIQRARGRHAEALAEARAVMLSAGVPAAAVAEVLGAGSAEGARMYLRGSLSALAERADRELVAPERLALLHAALGDGVRALSYLEEAAESRSPLLLGALRDPILGGLRREPRFVAIESAIGLRRV